MPSYEIRFSWDSRRGFPDPVTRVVDADSEAEARLKLADSLREPIVVHAIRQLKD